MWQAQAQSKTPQITIDRSMEEKTKLRALFEASLASKSSQEQPIASFSLALPVEEKEEEEEEEEKEKRPLSELLIELEKEISRKWPEPVGRKFFRSTEFQRKWEEDRPVIKSSTKQRVKKSLRKNEEVEAVLKMKHKRSKSTGRRKL